MSDAALQRSSSSVSWAGLTARHHEAPYAPGRLAGLAVLGVLALAAVGPPSAHASAQDPAYVIVLRVDELVPAEERRSAEDEPSEVVLPIAGFTWEIETPDRGSFGIGGAPPPERAHLTVLKAADDLSPLLVDALERRRVIPDLLLRPEGEDGGAYRLVDVTVRKVATKGDIEEVTFSYERVEIVDASATDPATQAPQAPSGR